MQDKKSTIDEAAAECARELEAKPGSSIAQAKRRASQKHKLAGVLRNSDIARHAKNTELKHRLATTRGRSMSGVCVIAVMLRPESCPYNCIYCPTSANAAKSYTGHEPAAMRARQNDFDSKRQVQSRIAQLRATGHEPIKNELIVMGGTFNSQPLDYQASFLKGCYDAFNGTDALSLDAAITQNETAGRRVVGLTFETRPDRINAQELKRLLSWGATRIELGVQSIDDKILLKAKRGHAVAQTVKATAQIKDAFLKVGYHIMPGLFSTPDADAAMYARLFSDPAFRPDMLKIYPTLVIPGTELHELWKKGEYRPYTNEEAAETIARILKECPPYVRVMRVDRDIPTHQIADGVKKTNLRELVDAVMKRNGWPCREIRSREIGLRELKGTGTTSGFELRRLDYEASGGNEVFLSYETKDDSIAAFLRLRKPGNNRTIDETKGDAAGIRELRVFGQQVPIGERSDGAAQHHSLGKKLVETAEEIARTEMDAARILVTSGVGVRQYYRRLGYERLGPYMTKEL